MCKLKVQEEFNFQVIATLYNDSLVLETSKKDGKYIVRLTDTQNTDVGVLRDDTFADDIFGMGDFLSSISEIFKAYDSVYTRDTFNVFKKMLTLAMEL